MPRLFVALDPGKDVLDRLARMIETLRRKAPDAKWVRPEGMHLTLAFLGSVESTRVPAICSALVGVAARHRPVVLAVQGGGVFGSPRRPRVLWAGISGDIEPLGAAQKDVQAALEPFGLAAEDRPYSPHLTLARTRDARGDPLLARCAEALAGQEFGQVRIEALGLYQSDLSPSGAKYTVLSRACFRQSI